MREGTEENTPMLLPSLTKNNQVGCPLSLPLSLSRITRCHCHCCDTPSDSPPPTTSHALPASDRSDSSSVSPAPSCHRQAVHRSSPLPPRRMLRLGGSYLSPVGPKLPYSCHCRRRRRLRQVMGRDGRGRGPCSSGGSHGSNYWGSRRVWFRRRARASRGCWLFGSRRGGCLGWMPWYLFYFPSFLSSLSPCFWSSDRRLCGPKRNVEACLVLFPSVQGCDEYWALGGSGFSLLQLGGCKMQLLMAFCNL